MRIFFYVWNNIAELLCYDRSKEKEIWKRKEKKLNIRKELILDFNKISKKKNFFSPS